LRGEVTGENVWNVEEGLMVGGTEESVWNEGEELRSECTVESM
jgi:hypothetical protein